MKDILGLFIPATKYGAWVEEVNWPNWEFWGNVGVFLNCVFYGLCPANATMSRVDGFVETKSGNAADFSWDQTV
ncbi:hypothetical protein [Paludisphaera borealis]|uniref:hypothetical protein n=1 Tax=Paludisphaera borealis TaxID=1387353 RepID=UPI0011AB8A1D|nr:hypothetical protein [Paludisphaera borealis]